MSREWKPGDVAMVEVRSELAPGDGRPHLWTEVMASRNDGCWVDLADMDWFYKDTPQCSDWRSARPLVVIAPEDRAAVERLRDLVLDALRSQIGYEAGGFHGFTVGDLGNATQAALREFADPTPLKVYHEHAGALAPWPVVDECRSSHRDGHECPQCAWEHEHDWVAWVTRTNTVGFSNGTPIRCSKCGARKCDHDDCALRRHTHNHQEES